jgi:hypothetical protein
MSRARPRSFAALALAAVVAGPGCLSLGHKPIALAPECAAACDDVPCACRGKVYVFLLSGFDPLDLDHVSDFRAALIRAGFTKVYNGQFYHDRFFAKEMRRLSTEQPDAKFVLVGFSLGAEAAVSLAKSVGEHRIPVALLASVDPYWWSSAPTNKPDNVEQVMHVHGERLLIPPTLSVGQDVQIPASFPSNVTANAFTVETLARSLANVAGTLPPPGAPPAAEPPDEMPSPRPVARADAPSDAWDFLRPMAKLPSLTGSPGEERTSLRPVMPRLAE